MLETVGLTFFLDLLQELSFCFHLTDVPILLLLPVFKGSGELLEQVERPERAAPGASGMIAVQNLFRGLISVIRGSLQPAEGE